MRVYAKWCDEMGYVAGIDLGGTTAKMGLFSQDEELLEKWEIPTRADDAGAAILPDIAASLRTYLLRRGASLCDLVGVGMGIPGAVRGDGYVEPCVNLHGWGGFDVGHEASLLCGAPVSVLNDANAAALGEMSRGGGEGFSNVLFVTLGTGVGGGIVVEGKLLVGSHGAGGEIGHVKVEGTGERCGCGDCDCLECYASATGIVRSARRALEKGGAVSALRGYERLTCKDVFDCAKKGDVLAGDVVDDAAWTLGKALAGISCVCDPEVVVVGGGVSRAGEFYLDKVRRAFAENAFPAMKRTPVVAARLGNDAGMYGAARFALTKGLA